ncbi:MAG: cell division protein ZapA [Alphaproteobacteria bacterium]|nr:cell division protein ZapA [Alphaproteobacteria bacterium]
MAEITININGRQYRVACENGQEEHVAALGAKVDARVRELAGGAGAVGDAMLLAMASLMISDELGDAERALSEARAATSAHHDTSDDLIADRIEALAARLEKVAASIEAA